MRAAWESNGVFTLAQCFEEEIEAHMRRIDATTWQQVTSETGSKPHKGRLFAERVAPPDELRELYTNVLRHLGLRCAGDAENPATQPPSQT